MEWPEGPVFFALNIDMPNGIDDAPKRTQIAREVLQRIGALNDCPGPVACPHGA